MAFKWLSRLFVLFFITFLGIIAFPWAGKSYFLGDQLDQILHVPHLLKGSLHLLYGPVFSDTSPPVYALGFIINLLYGLPFMLGANPDHIHLIQMGLVILGLVPLFFRLRALNEDWGYLFCTLIAFTGIFHWTLTIFWLNAFQLPLACCFFASYLAFLRSPSLNLLILVIGFFLLPLHIHSTPSVAWPFVAQTIALSWSRRHQSAFRLHTIRPASIVLIIAGTAPYIIAEAIHNLKNFRAFLAYFSRGSASSDSLQAGLTGSIQAAQRLFDVSPISLQPPWITTLSLQGFLGWSFALWFLGYFMRSLRHLREGTLTHSDYIFLATFFSIAYQCSFFYFTHRDLRGPHYTLFMLPVYLFPWIILLSQIMQILRIPKFAIPVLASAALLLTRNFPEKYHETTQWTFQNTKKALESICLHNPHFQVFAEPAFRGYQEEFEDSLNFVSTHFLKTCHKQDNGAKALLRVDRHGEFPDNFEYKGVRYSKKLVESPGIALYQRSDTL